MKPGTQNPLIKRGELCVIGAASPLMCDSCNIHTKSEETKSKVPTLALILNHRSVRDDLEIKEHPPITKGHILSPTNFTEQVDACAFKSSQRRRQRQQIWDNYSYSLDHWPNQGWNLRNWTELTKSRRGFGGVYLDSRWLRVFWTRFFFLHFTLPWF